MSASALLPAVGVQVVFVDEVGVKQSGALEVLWRTGFERVSPVRSFGSFRGQRSFQGSWWFATTGEHVGFESWVERDAVMLLDFDPDVVAVSSQPFCLRWAGQPRVRRPWPQEVLGHAATDAGSRSEQAARPGWNTTQSGAAVRRYTVLYRRGGARAAELAASDFRPFPAVRVKAVSRLAQDL